MKPIVKLIIAILLLQSNVIAQIPKHIEQWQPNVCRVTARDASGIGGGSGAYLGKGYEGKGFVLTAYHVVRDYHKTLLANRKSLSVTFNEQGKYEATLKGWDTRSDIAILEIDIPREANIKGVMLAVDDPKVGDIAWKCGYGPDDRLIWHKCTVTGLTQNQYGDRCWFDMTPWARSGDSGGPVFDANGRLLGNLWGSSPEENATTAVKPSALKQVISKSLSHLVNYHVQCYGPNCYQQNPFMWGGQQPQYQGPQIQPPQGGGDPRLLQPAPGGFPANPNPQNTNPIQPNPTPNSPAPSNPQQMVPVQPKVDLSPLEKSIEDLKSQFGKYTKPADNSNLKIQIDSLSNENKSIKATVDSLAGRLKDLPDQLSGKINSAITGQTPTVTEPKESGFDWSNILWSAGIAAAGLAGVGLPAWGIWALRAAGVAKRGIRRVRERRQAQSPEFSQAQEPPPVPITHQEMEQREPVHTETRYIVDGPSLPARHTIESRLVHAPVDRYEVAHEQAREHIFRRYPGSQEILEAEKNLTKQFLAGEKS